MTFGMQVVTVRVFDHDDLGLLNPTHNGLLNPTPNGLLNPTHNGLLNPTPNGLLNPTARSCESGDSARVRSRRPRET